MYHLITGLYSEWSRRPQFNVLVLGASGAGKTALLDKVRAWHTRTSSRPLARIAPTVGQNVLDLTFKHAILHFWDLGGEASLRKIWPQYFEEAEVLVWVMDISDWLDEDEVEHSYSKEQDDDDDHERGTPNEQEAKAARQEDSWSALASLRSHSRIRALPLLIVLTKMDHVSSAAASSSRTRMKGLLADRLAGLEEAEESDLRDEMENIDGLARPKAGSGAWEDWDVVGCSAKDGTGLATLVDWLNARAQQRPRRSNR